MGDGRASKGLGSDGGAHDDLALADHSPQSIHEMLQSENPYVRAAAMRAVQEWRKRQRQGDAQAQGAIKGEVNAEIGDAEMQVVEAADEKAPSNARAALNEWLSQGENAIHHGLEDALLGEICKQLDVAEEATQEKVIDSLKDHAKEHLIERAKGSIKNAPVKNATGHAAKSKTSNEATHLAKSAGAAVGVVMEVKELVDTFEESLVSEVKAKTLQELVHKIQKKSTTEFAAYRARLAQLTDGELIVALQTTDLSRPLFERHAVAFWFNQVVQSTMVKSGVLKGAALDEGIKAMMNPAPPEGAGGEAKKE